MPLNIRKKLSIYQCHGKVVGSDWPSCKWKTQNSAQRCAKTRSERDTPFVIVLSCNFPLSAALVMIISLSLIISVPDFECDLHVIENHALYKGLKAFIWDSRVCLLSLHWQDGRIRHALYQVCLDVEGESLVVRKCDDRQTQKWRFSAYPEEARNKTNQEKIL